MKYKAAIGSFVNMMLVFTLTSYALDTTISNEVTDDMSIVPQEEFLTLSTEATEYAEVIDLNEQLVYSDCSKINSTITFSTPQKSEDVINYLDVNDISPKFVTGRIISETGEKLTFCANIQKNSVDTVEESIKQNEDGDFIGFISVQGYIDSDEIGLITNDTRTLLLDTSYYVKGIDENNDEYLNSFPKDISWEYEEFLNESTR